MPIPSFSFLCSILFISKNTMSCRRNVTFIKFTITPNVTQSFKFCLLFFYFFIFFLCVPSFHQKMSIFLYFFLFIPPFFPFLCYNITFLTFLNIFPINKELLCCDGILWRYRNENSNWNLIRLLKKSLNLCTAYKTILLILNFKTKVHPIRCFSQFNWIDTNKLIFYSVPLINVDKFIRKWMKFSSGNHEKFH